MLSDLVISEEGKYQKQTSEQLRGKLNHAFLFGCGAKKNRGTGFSVLAVQRMEREPRMKGGGGGGGEEMKWLQTNPGILKIPPPVNRAPDWLG